MKEFYKCFLKAQIEIDSATKDSSNPHFRSRYESLEAVIDAIKKPLNKHGIIITHSTTSNFLLVTKLIHAESGEYIESTTNLLMLKQDMQQLGSAATYAKRQNLKALTNLPSEDDDGNSVSQKNKSKPQPQAHKPDQSNDGVYVFKAGKAKGTKITDVSDDQILGYYNWIQKQPDVKGYLLEDFEAMKKVIDERGIVPF